MHAADAGMVERGDMFSNRQQPNRLVKLLAPLAFRLGKSDRFSPDFYLSEGDSLGRFGLDADVIHLPGHSQGSIGIRLAHDHALIGGDLLTNRNEPGLNSLMDDPAAADASVAKLAQLEIGTVYPGHGRPFPLADFLARHHAAGPAP
jgi:glyoxylase-like metal-dependent hydrolase (beta-lactamase superfamily II)